MPSLHDLQWVVSHNSYVRPVPFDPATLYGKGFRGFELDIWKSPGHVWDWCVNHTDGYHEADRKLASYLDDLALVVTPDADPVFLHLDVKDPVMPAGFADALDVCLRGTLADRVFRPTDLMDAAGAWREWPDPASPELRGRVIVVISGTEACKKAYASTGPRAVLAFPDFNPYQGSKRLIANTGYQESYLGGAFGTWRCARPSLLWRVYGDGSGAKAWLKRFSETGANMLALDFDGTSVLRDGKAFWPNPLCKGK